MKEALLNLENSSLSNHVVTHLQSLVCMGFRWGKAEGLAMGETKASFIKRPRREPDREMFKSSRGTQSSPKHIYLRLDANQTGMKKDQVRLLAYLHLPTRQTPQQPE